MEKIVVQKYGGSSVATPEKMKSVAKRVIAKREEGYQVVVVVSAMGKSTNQLMAMAKQISPDPRKRELDSLLATGEQVSIALLSMALNHMGQKAVSLTGIQAGVKTRGIHTKNKIVDINEAVIRKYLKEGNIVIVAGFQGVNESGDITTLGRGGSDTSAVAIAAKLQSPCEIYTDVAGIYAIDPRIYPLAKKLNTICYEEMMEFSCLGAKVMEPRAVEIAGRYEVPLYVASSMSEECGTMIKECEQQMEENVITGISLTEDVAMITFDNILHESQDVARIFHQMAQEQINIDMISQTAPMNKLINLSFTAPMTDEIAIDQLAASFCREQKQVVYRKKTDVVKLSVVGYGMRNQPGVAARLFQILSENHIPLLQITTSEISISYIINEEDKDRTVEILGKELNL